MLRSAECARPIRPVTQRPSAEGLSEQAQSALLAPRDTFPGVGVGRKTGSEAGEAIRLGYFVSRRLGVCSRRHLFDIGPPVGRYPSR